jgi:hypothetical protein
MLYTHRFPTVNDFIGRRDESVCAESGDKTIPTANIANKHSAVALATAFMEQKHIIVRKK